MWFPSAGAQGYLIGCVVSPGLDQAVLTNSEQKVVLWNVLENRLTRVLDYPRASITGR